MVFKGQKWITQRDVRFTAVYTYLRKKKTQTIVITANWLDSLDSSIESVTIYREGESMQWYHNTLFLSLTPYGVNFFFGGGV